VKSLTVRMHADLRRRLDRAAKRNGQSRSAVVRESLRRQLALGELVDLRRRIIPFAEAAGYCTDEDVFSEVS
jgi:predicted transcriptional regulator